MNRRLLDFFAGCAFGVTFALLLPAGAAPATSTVAPLTYAAPDRIDVATVAPEAPGAAVAAPQPPRSTVAAMSIVTYEPAPPVAPEPVAAEPVEAPPVAIIEPLVIERRPCAAGYVEDAGGYFLYWHADPNGGYGDGTAAYTFGPEDGCEAGYVPCYNFAQPPPHTVEFGELPQCPWIVDYTKVPQAPVP